MSNLAHALSKLVLSKIDGFTVFVVKEHFTMWKTSVIAFQAFLWLPGFVMFVSGECLLNTAMYMPFIVRIADITPNKGKGDTIATGSIITPDTVLTTCIGLKGFAVRDLECQATQAHYKVGKVDSNHFKEADDREDTKGCMEKRYVRYKLEHPRCPLSTSRYEEYGQDYTRYNIAVLRVVEPFKNYTEAVPAMPFVSDIATQLAMIDAFNSLRTERCEIPLFNGVEPKIRFQKHMSFRSMPLQSECKEHMCKDAGSDCQPTVANHTGFVLCAKRVSQREQGITWSDYFSQDTDLWDIHTCENQLNYVVGAPLVCRGTVIGIVTECKSYGLVISTIYALRIFLHQVVDAGYTEKVIFMDTGDIPTEKDGPKSRSSSFQEKSQKQQSTYRFFFVCGYYTVQ